MSIRLSNQPLVHQQTKRPNMKAKVYKTLKRMRTALLLASVCVGLVASNTHADDIDAYLVKPPEIKPSSNLLFILDESGSMRSRNSEGKSRRDQLRDAMKGILAEDSIQHFNVAVMGYTTSNGRPLLTVFGGFNRLDKEYQVGGQTLTFSSIMRNRMDQIKNSALTPSAIALNVGAEWFTDGWRWNNHRTFNAEHWVAGRNSRFTLLWGRNYMSLGSPLKKENWCAKNHIILLSDGAPNAGIPANRQIISLNDSASPTLELTRANRTNYLNRIYTPIGQSGVMGNTYSGVETMYRLNGLTGTNRASAKNMVENLSDRNNYCKPHYQNFYTDPVYTWNGRRYNSSQSGICSTDIAEFLGNNDLRPDNDFPQKQNIVVNTIGFAMRANSWEENYLKSIAEAGKGKYFLAGNERDLFNAFSSIASAANTTADYAFNAPSLPIDTSNPTAIADKIFLPLFKPSTRKIWVGNLKAYSITQGVTIYGKNNVRAFNANSTLNSAADDLFTPTNLDAMDGSEINYGGTASRINRATDRTIYTQSNRTSVTGLKKLSATIPLLVNQASLYSAQVLTTDVVCSNVNTAQGCILPTDMDRYGSYLTDKSSITTTYFSLPTPTSTLVPTVNSIELTLPPTARVPQPQSIKIFADSTHRATLPTDIKVVITRTDSTTQEWTNLNLRSGDVTLTPDTTNGKPYPIQAVKITCNSGCSANQLLAIAEVEIIENPANSGDIQWFLNESLPSNLIETRTGQDNKTFTVTVSKMGAPIHTKPIIVKYPNRDVVFLPTSEGVLHAFEATPDSSNYGEELWGFMPSELLGNIGLLRNNDTLASDEAPEYGLDGQPYYYELDRGGIKFKALVFGMRRGGRSYFSIDITDPDSPKLMWEINPTTPGFSKIGQTWAQPYPAPILLKGQRIRTIILSGGYFPNSDQRTEHKASATAAWNKDDYGNRIYFIDPNTGKLKIVITNDATERYDSDVEKVVVPKLLNGIVAQPMKANIFLPKSYRNTYDRFYFADTGGRIIRVDIDSLKSSTQPGPFVTAAVIAELGGAGAENYIRFMTQPAVVKGENQQNLSIIIGSGNRSKLLNKNNIDRIYAVLDTQTYTRAHSGNPVTEADLYDSTSNKLQKIKNPTAQELQEQANAQATLNAKAGWYIKLGEKIAPSPPYSGEKVINKVKFSSGIIYFNTVEITTEPPKIESCSAAVPSTNKVKNYAISLKDGTSVYKEFDGEDTDADDLPTTRDRYRVQTNSGGGLPTELTLLRVDPTKTTNPNNDPNKPKKCESGMYITSNIAGKWLCVKGNNKLQGISWEEIIGN